MSLAALAARARRHLSSRTGWRGAATGFGLGALAALALPPVFAVPVLWLAVPGLLFLLDGRTSLRGAFATGFWFGLGFFLAGLYWITFAILHEAERFFWLVPIAVPAIAAGLALFLALGVAAAFLAPAGVPRLLALAGAWTLAEMLRGVLFTGFPWNLIGTVWAFDALPLQGAALVGAYGLSLTTMILAGLPALLAAPAPGQAPTASARRLAACAGAILLAGLGLGLVRLWPAEPEPPGPVLRLVQGNVPQEQKWEDEVRLRNFRRHLMLTQAGSTPPEGALLAVIWPETASPYPLESVPQARALAAQALPERALLLAGSVRVAEREPADNRGSNPRIQLWNSLYAIDRAGEIQARYDKSHLVPFGEYVPLRWLLPFGTIVRGGLDFTAGPGKQTLRVPGLPPFSALICYEAIFPGAVVNRAERPGWIVNVTNDAWFGTSSGPYQHLAAARLRAVEEGLPVARAANTGISAVFDARGRVVASLGLNQTGVVEAPLPGALPPTLFAQWGTWAPLLLAGLIYGLGLWLGWRRIPLGSSH